MEKKERPILFPAEESSPLGSRPWRYKGGTKAAQDRYRNVNAESIRLRKREEYRRNAAKYRERSAKWRQENPEKWKSLMRESNRRQRSRLWMETLEAYGGRCACCNETESMFLEIDHIKNDGAEDRKSGNGGGAKLMGRLKKAGWPKDSYQLLCSNCNQGKRRNGGICPHQQK